MFLLYLMQSFATIKWNLAGSIEITISAARISFSLELSLNTSSFIALELEWLFNNIFIFAICLSATIIN